MRSLFCLRILPHVPAFFILLLFLKKQCFLSCFRYCDVRFCFVKYNLHKTPLTHNTREKTNACVHEHKHYYTELTRRYNPVALSRQLRLIKASGGRIENTLAWANVSAPTVPAFPCSRRARDRACSAQPSTPLNCTLGLT